MTEVHPPTSDEEAVRDLCRCREDAQEDRTRARQRMGKFLLRRALIFTASKSAWDKLHRQWLRGLTFEHAADQAVSDNYLLAIEHLEERLRTLDRQLVETAWHYRHRAKIGEMLRARRRGQPGHVIALGDRAQERLCRRYRHLIECGSRFRGPLIRSPPSKSVVSRS